MRALILALLLVFCLAAFADRAVAETKIVNITVTDRGFEPSQIKVAPQSDVILKIKRISENTCSTAVQVPTLKIRKALPLNKTITLALGKLPQGEVKFGCMMDMMEGGVIHVE